MRSTPKLCSKSIQILLCILAAIALLFYLNPSAPQKIPVPISRRIYENKAGSQASSAIYSSDDIVDYRRCSPFETLRLFVHPFEHPLALVALSKSLVAALSQRIQIDLPLRPPVPSKLIAPNGVFRNISYNFTRIPSKFGTRQRSASRLYSRARWSSGRDLTYTSSTLHDVPMMPGDAPFYEGTKENIAAVNGNTRLGLTRDEEQFTAIILTYDRDDGVKKIIEKLRNCPYLNKILVVWNNLDRRPNGTWPEIHVPVEFILAERNTLLSRFLPYDRIETEAIVSLDDDIGTDQAELTFGFRMWRENRDRLVGYPERYHKFENGKGMYGLSGNCEHSLILTGYTFVHKEFLIEFSYNQHPSILEFIEKNRNCEDLAMNYLVAHLTRKPPLKVIKKVDINNGSARSGLSSRGNHYKERDGCIQMLSALYGYNPLLRWIFRLKIVSFHYIPPQNCASVIAYWQFSMTGFSIGTFASNAQTDAISATGVSWIGAPAAAVQGIVQATGAQFDWFNQLYTVKCKGSYPDMIFTIGGRAYNIPSSEYVIDLGLGGGNCALTVFEQPGGSFGASWTLGDTWIRTYCQIHDVGQARIGFARAHHSEI